MASSSRKTLFAHLSLVAIVLVWGATFPLVKSALADVSPLLFNLLRMVIAFVLLAVCNWRLLAPQRRAEGNPKGELQTSGVLDVPILTRSPTRTQLRHGVLAGLFLGVGYQFQTAGLARTTASKSAFITGLVVVFVPLLSLLPGVCPAGAAKPGAVAFFGAGVAFAGLVLLTTPPGSGTALLSGFGAGEWLTLCCAVAFAAHLLTLSRAGAYVGARLLATLQVGFAALLMLITLPLAGHLAFHPTPRVLAALAVTALLATALAFVVQSWVQQIIPASHTALIVTLEPVFAWLTSLLFLGERLGPRALAGAATILAGILAAELLPFRATSEKTLP